MVDYSKGKDYSITLGIPIITGIILGLLEIYGKEYLTPVILIGLGAFICFGIFYVSIRFLEKRELRWVGNKKIHEELRNKLNSIQQEFIEIKSDMRANEKINKLESRISYCEGRLKK